jgi:hypothetical protein
MPFAHSVRPDLVDDGAPLPPEIEPSNRGRQDSVDIYRSPGQSRGSKKGQPDLRKADLLPRSSGGDRRGLRLNATATDDFRRQRPG